MPALEKESHEAIACRNFVTMVQTEMFLRYQARALAKLITSAALFLLPVLLSLFFPEFQALGPSSRRVGYAAYDEDYWRFRAGETTGVLIYTDYAVFL